jgi:hypothetical protein
MEPGDLLRGVLEALGIEAGPVVERLRGRLGGLGRGTPP